MKRTVVIAQARMGSSRLPGKVLERLGSKPVLLHVLDRASQIARVDEVCLATTDLAQDDTVAKIASDAGYPVFRGNEKDVLSRYVGAAQMLQADHIIRITCDCPLIDPAICGDVLALIENGAAYSSNVPDEGRSWPHGLDCEAFLRSELERAHANTQDSNDREHVTPWLRRNSKPREYLPGPGGEAAKQRWTLDYPEDLTLLKEIFGLLPTNSTTLDWHEVMKLVKSHSELSTINTHRRIAN